MIDQSVFSEQMQDQSRSIGYPLAVPAYVALELFTLGIYTLYWSYQHFSRAFHGTKAKVPRALICSFFLPLSLHSLMKYYDRCARSAGDRFRLPILPTALLFFCNHLVSTFGSKYLPHYAPLINLVVAVTILGFIQNEVNRINRKLRPDLLSSQVMTGRLWIGLAVGFVVFFMIIGLFFLLTLLR